MLGESLNSGWEATGPGDRSLGAPQLIDGYANGWYVSPPSTSFIVTLRFAPQQMVVPAIVASGTTLVLCLVVGFVPIGPIRRRPRRGGAHWAAAEQQAPPKATLPMPALAPSTPKLVALFANRTRAPNVGTCFLVAALCGGLCLAVLPPPSAPFVAGAIALGALLSFRFFVVRSLLRLSALGCMLVAGAMTVLGEIAHHYPAGSSWPHNFETAGVLAFVGVVALVCETVVSLVQQRQESNEERQI